MEDQRSRRPASDEGLAPVQQAANLVAREANADVLFLNGPLDRPIGLTVMDICESRPRRNSVIFMLVTEGGDADAAYQIARCLQTSYEQFTFFGERLLQERWHARRSRCSSDRDGGSRRVGPS